MRFDGYERKVAFVDTDAASIVHYTNVLRFVEEAEHAALESLDLPVLSRLGGFPKVRVECDYQSPLKFGDVAEVQLEIVRVGEKSLHWEFVVRVGERLAAQGGMVTVWVNAQGVGEVMPEEWRGKLGVRS